MASKADYCFIIPGWVGMPDTKDPDPFPKVDPFVLPPDLEAPVDSDPVVPDN